MEEEQQKIEEASY